jgi:hypothetical protein
MGLSKMDDDTVGVEAATGVSRMDVGIAIVGADTAGVAGCPPQPVARRQIRNRKGDTSGSRGSIMNLRSPPGREEKSHQKDLMALLGNP